MDPSARRLKGQRLEEGLCALLYDASLRDRQRAGEAPDPLLSSLDPTELEEAAASVRRMVEARAHRGTGGLKDWFPKTLSAWRKEHLDGGTEADAGWLDRLLEDFCASLSCAGWRETPGGRPGLSLEESLYRFFESRAIGDATVREEEFIGAVIRGLAVAPTSSFVRPAIVRAAPGGCFAVTRAGVLHAALDGKYLRGEVTPLIAAILSGEPSERIAARSGTTVSDVERVRAELRHLRLIEGEQRGP